MYRKILTLSLIGALVVVIAAPTVLAAESHPSDAMVAAATAEPGEELIEPDAIPAVLAGARMFHVISGTRMLTRGFRQVASAGGIGQQARAAAEDGGIWVAGGDLAVPDDGEAFGVLLNIEIIFDR